MPKTARRTCTPPSPRSRVAGLSLGCLVLLLGSPALAEPPIRSAQDAACRNEARARVFSVPDPQGLGPHAIGRQIYMACMKRGEPRRRRRG
ncbi:hypothetical protein [Methylobacterium sp. A54F]